METKKFEVVSAESSIDWIGKKVTGAHNGTIAIKGGSLSLDANKLTGGNFVIDTTSIEILDITDAATNRQFADHLFSEDFFAVEKYPESFFAVTHVNPLDETNYEITGDLTIKGITHPVNFPVSVNITDSKITASGKIIVDRTKYDMKFRSGNFFTNLGDTLIYNEFELDVKLTATL